MLKSQKYLDNPTVSNEELIGVIDIGTSGIVAIVAGVMPEALGEQTTEVLGVAHHVPAFEMNGALLELNAVEAVNHAVRKAVSMANQEPEHWYVSVSGVDIICQGLRVEMELADSQVMQEDIADCTSQARHMATAGQHDLLHLWMPESSVDGFGNIHDPLGLSGTNLSMHYTAIAVPETVTHNLRKMLAGIDVEVKDFVAAPYAASRAVVLEDELKVGVLTLDMGASVTNFSLFKNGAIIFTGAVPLGGNHLTEDIATSYDISLGQAERVKILFGTAYCSPGDENRHADFGSAVIDRDTSIAALAEISGPRIKSILQDVAQKCAAVDIDISVVSRIVLTGGASQLQGVAILVEELTGIKTRLGKPRRFFCAPEAVASPGYAVSTGMIVHVEELRREAPQAMPDIATCNINPTNRLLARATEAQFGISKLTNWLRARF